MDSLSGRRSEPWIMLLLEGLIILILLLDIDHPRQIGALRGVYGMFWRIFDSPKVLCRLPL